MLSTVVQAAVLTIYTSKNVQSSLSAPQRIPLMSVIPNGDDRTSLGARHCTT